MWHTRDEWGALPPKADPGVFNPQNIRGVCIHYSGSKTLANVNVAAHFAGVQRFYLAGANSGENYADIAYNVGVDAFGDVWELRGVTKRGGANGSSDSNARYPSIYLVLGTDDNVTPEMVAGVREAITRYRQLYPGCTEIRPHSDFYNTSCPGPALQLIHSGAFEPIAAAVIPAPVMEEEEDMASLIQVNDGDFAVFATNGIEACWIIDYNGMHELQEAGALRKTVTLVSRTTLRNLRLVGPAPLYDAGYSGPRTTSDQFRSVAVETVFQPGQPIDASAVADELARRLAS